MKVPARRGKYTIFTEFIFSVMYFFERCDGVCWKGETGCLLSTCQCPSMPVLEKNVLILPHHTHHHHAHHQTHHHAHHHAHSTHSPPPHRHYFFLAHLTLKRPSPLQSHQTSNLPHHHRHHHHTLLRAARHLRRPTCVTFANTTTKSSHSGTNNLQTLTTRCPSTPSSPHKTQRTCCPLSPHPHTSPLLLSLSLLSPIPYSPRK